MSLKTNLLKAKRYFQKNGIKNMIYACAERIFFPYNKQYTYKEMDEATFNAQKTHQFSINPCFSIVVPTYETKEKYLREMIDSVLAQSYSNLELILADASSTEQVENVVLTYDDKRIVYKKLDKNQGISENTNQGIQLAKGEYIGLLDHDDLLTRDALYEVVCKIEEEKKAGYEAKIIYSDEDKCSGQGTVFFAPHYKMDFNKELLFTNNYICHFLVTDAKIMKELLLRKEYDGAQDFDFVLRATALVEKKKNLGEKVCISHIRKILYHWRCHEQSTAENPESKMYAYEAGKMASVDARKEQKEALHMVHEKHLGFYRADIENIQELFMAKPNLACVGGAVYKRNKVIGGAMEENGNVLYDGLPRGFSGYMNRAILMQSADAIDLRNMILRKELWQEFEKQTGFPYVPKSETDRTFDYKKALGQKENQIDFKKKSLEFCNVVKEMGYEIIYWER